MMLESGFFSWRDDKNNRKNNGYFFLGINFPTSKTTNDF